MKSTDLPLVSVVFVTYERPHTLVATVETFLAFTDYPRDRLELILADDASGPAARRVHDALPFDKRVVAPRNAGLGANQNRGIAAARGDYVLMLQDDFMLVGRHDYLKVALGVLGDALDIGMILFRERDALPDREERNVAGELVWLLGSSDKAPIKCVAQGSYSDNPHLKRRDFHDVVGRFVEGVPMTDMELAMSRAVAAQDHYAVAIVDGVAPFKHIGDRFSFNPGIRRHARIEAIETLPGGRLLAAAAKRIKRTLRT